MPGYYTRRPRSAITIRTITRIKMMVPMPIYMAGVYFERRVTYNVRLPSTVSTAT